MVELFNDDTYQCESCDEIFKAFTSSGETSFCPCCGSRKIDGYDGETE